jgi:hypothetical protein
MTDKTGQVMNGGYIIIDLIFTLTLRFRIQHSVFISIMKITRVFAHLVGEQRLDMPDYQSDCFN